MGEKPTNLKTQILIATGIGLALRLAWWGYAQPQPVSDFEYIRRLAESLLDHHQYGYPQPDSGRMPGYPAVLAGFMLISRSVAWLSLATVLISTLLVPLLGMLSHRLRLPVLVSVVAAYACALNPTFVFYAPVLATEHLFAVLLIAALVVLLGRAPDGAAAPLITTRRCAAAGVVLGLAAMTRVDALFYAPVFVAIVWARAGSSLPEDRLRSRLAGLAALVASAAVILAPWYVRNRVAVGPGAGLSTSGGPTFYFAHNDRMYGWHPLRGTPLEGLNQLETQRRGYELGFDYLRRAGARRIVSDIVTGTIRLYSPLSTPYSLRWSTRQPGATPDEFSARPIAGLRAFEFGAGVYAVIFGLGLLSVFFAREYPAIASATLYGTVLINWIVHGWIFLGDPRYRYIAEVAFCVLAAMAAVSIWRLVRAPGEPARLR